MENFRGKYHATQHFSKTALFPGGDLLLVFQILNGLVSPFPALVLAPEFWLVLFPLSVFVLAQQYKFSANQMSHIETLNPDNVC